MRLPKLSLLLGIFTLFMANCVFAQEINVSGTVLADESGAALAAVTVTNKTTGKKVITNDAGNFDVKAVVGHVLSFSYVGYASKEVPVTGNRMIVRLTSSNSELTGVVITGYGQGRNKRELAYQAPEVSGKEIAQTRRGNFLNSLAGRVPGLTVTSTSGLPGASAQIMLRGGVSIGGSNQPLFVVDGVPLDNSGFDQESLVQGSSVTGSAAATAFANRGSDYTNRIADINPEDIENVVVLKGPEATSIYGSDGAAGAIVITTRKGKSGKGRISYTNSFSVSEVYRFPELQSVYTRGNNGIYDPAAFSTLYGYRYFGPKYPEGTTLYNNMENFFQKAFSQQHNLSLDGGSQDLSYRFSAGYLNQGGVVPNADYTRYNFRFTANARLNKVFNLSSTWAYIYSENNKATKGPGSFYTSLMTYPQDVNAEDYLNPDGTRKLLRSVDPSVEFDSPFWEVNKNKAYDETDRITGNVNLSANIADGLSMNGIIGVDQYSSTGYLYFHPQSRTAFTLKGFMSTYEQVYRGLNGTARINYKKKIGDKISNDFNLGTYFENINNNTNSQRGERFYEPDFISINNSDPTSRDARLTRVQTRKSRFFAGYTMGYDNILYLSLTGTREGTSTLTSKFLDKQPFYNFGSVSGSFILSDLDFMKPLEWLSFAKLRASYASTGRGPIRPYIIDNQFTPSDYTGGGFALGVTLSNPDLTPEFSNNLELGGEFKFLNNRLGIDVAYFNNKVKNQIIANRTSYATGAIITYINGGRLSAKGWEIQATGTPVKSNRFTWRTILNFDKAKTVVEEMPGGLPIYYDSDTWVFGNVRSQLGKGVSLGNLSGPTFQRNKDGKLIINPTSGLPIVTSTSDLVPIGDRTPDFKIGLINTFELGESWTLSFNLDIRKGGDVFNGNEMMLTLQGLSKRTLDREEPRVIEGVLNDGLQDSDHPTVNTIALTPYFRNDYYNGIIAEADYIESVDWVRMRDITLSYNLPSALLKRQKVLTGATIFVTGTDLFLITNYSGIDPNVNILNASTAKGFGGAGIDYGAIPNPRTINFGVTLNF